MIDEMSPTSAESEIGPPEILSAGKAPGGDPCSNREPVARTFEPCELKGIVESLLFVSQEPLSLQRLVTVIGDVTKAEVADALRILEEELGKQGRGIRLVEVAGGFRLVTKQEYAPWIKRLDKSKSTAKLSRSALESLAIIAYKQPIVKAEIEEIRGVETSGVVRTLLERKLVRIVGRKEVPGRPIMYGTTKYFLEHFGLNDLSQLPPLREFKELGESEQTLLPMDEAEKFAANGSAHVADRLRDDVSGERGDELPETTVEKKREGQVETELKAELSALPDPEPDGMLLDELDEPVEQT
ncbi:MAG: SMC-Scp complex subunit ScpB [Nitrospira sp.]|nr:SMC-Scp complex subunit ScpB [Nitrospira sp.]MCP9442553.1 SMC-Scp complex subunit ScpB [Nitrospira sp.]